MSVFQVGDVVQLKSGGPAMTIFLIKDQVAYCEWFVDHKKQPEQREFNFTSLQNYDNDGLLPFTS